MADDKKIDDVLKDLGFGRWQVPTLIVCIMGHFSLPVHMIGSTMTSAPVAFRCSLSKSLSRNVSIDLRIPIENQTISKDDGSNGEPFYNSECFYSNELEFRNDSFHHHNSEPDVTNIQAHPTGLPSCPWVAYDDSIFTSTVITEYDLICEREVLRPLFQMCFSVGVIIMSIIGGHFSDKYGRKRVLQITSILALCGVVTMFFMPWYEGVLVCRIVVGGLCNSLLFSSFNLLIEISPPKQRTLIGMLVGTSFSAAFAILAGLGYLIRSWRLLMITSSIPPLIIFISVSFFTSESPRWLIQRGRGAEASVTLARAASLHKVSFSQPIEAFIESMKKNPSPTSSNMEREQATASICDHLRRFFQGKTAFSKSNAFRIIVIITPIFWFSLGLMYLGIVLNANNFTSNNPFVYVCVSGLMDMTAIIIATPLSMRVGRRILMTSAFLVGGSLLLLDIVVPKSVLWLKFAMVMIALMLTAGALQISFIYTNELFPTMMRARGFGVSSLASNLGFLIAPLITDLLAKLSWWSVSFTIGVASFFSSTLIPLLPETLNEPLPETLEDVDKRHRRTKAFRNCCRKNKKTEGPTDEEEDFVEQQVPLQTQSQE